MASASSMHEAEPPKLVLWDNPEGWDGEGGGRGVQDAGGGHMYTCGQFILIYGQNHHNIVRWQWKALSHVRVFATPWTIQFMEFFRSEYWSGQPFLSPEDLPNPGIEPRSPELQADSLPAEPQGKLSSN